MNSPKVKLSILFIDKVLRSLLGLVSFIFLAKYLTPNEVGIYSLVMTIIVISAGLIGFGITSVVVVNAAKNYSENSNIIQRDFFIRFLSSFSIFGISLFLVFIFYGESEVSFYYLIASIYLISQISVTFENDLKARGDPHKIALIKILPTIFAFFAKLYVLINFNSLGLFFAVIVLESIVILISLIYLSSISMSSAILNNLNKSFLIEAYSLLKKSAPFLFSFIAMLLYTRIDQFFISEMIGFDQLAIYAVAIKIQDSAFALIFILNIYFIRHLSESFGTERFVFLFKGVSSLGVSAALVGLLLWIFFGNLILSILFDEIYQNSYIVTSILIASLMIQSAAVVRTNYYVLTKTQNIIYVSSLSGLIINLLLNYILIPIYGIEGAAFASLISQTISLLLINLFYKKTREVFLWMSYSLLFPFNMYNFKLLKQIILGKIK